MKTQSTFESTTTKFSSSSPDTSIWSTVSENADHALDTASRLISETAHDLRSPLSGIREVMRIVCDGETGPVTPLQREMLGDAISQCDSIRSLVDNMLQLERLRSGLPAVERRWFPLSELKADCESVIASIALARRVDVMWQGFDGGAENVFGDASLLRRLIINLAGNAVAVSAERSRVMISARSSVHRGMIRLLVSDHGPGMPTESIANLASRGASGTGGSGLGLAIGKSLAALHFGRMIVSSQPGRGTRIGVELATSGPASVADMFSRWRETVAPSRGRLSVDRIGHDSTTQVANSLAMRDSELRIDAPESIKPGLYRDEVLLGFEGRAPRFPDQVICHGLRIDGAMTVVQGEKIDSLLQTNQRIHELVYRTDPRRWVLLWDNTVEESKRRTADLDRKIRGALGVEQLAWQAPIIQSVSHRSDRAKIREILVRDTLHASSRIPMFDDVFTRDGQPLILDPLDETASRRLDEELRRLSTVLRKQSKRLHGQAKGLEQIIQ